MTTFTSPETLGSQSLEQRAVNTIRVLAMDAVQKANSGHPGLPMGAADLAYVLFSRFLKFDASAPDWADRDRFILSAGHGCMLHYALLYLTGYDVSLDDLKDFRQWGSNTPGHPEFGHTAGIETTTGPLGQGIATAVGMAMAETHLAGRLNRADLKQIDHFTYVLASDGDMMEGVQAEAVSLAGHLGLGKLIVMYDDNKITIDGETDLAFSEDVRKRYEAYGWHVQSINGHDRDAIAGALAAAKKETGRPSLIAARTVIALGSPNKEGSEEAHGSPLGDEEIAATKAIYGWPVEPKFMVPDDVLEHFRAMGSTHRSDRERWEKQTAD
ncbi:MAG: transketolase, partial [Candidatus Eisenbacteria bacterium]|nr:transketolase [Candidatus Eisenbacteria bacterium]